MRKSPNPHKCTEIERVRERACLRDQVVETILPCLVFDFFNRLSA